MEYSLQIEKPSSVVRKLTIKVPPHVVKDHLDKGYVSLQRETKVKGFRPGQAPISILQKYYGEDLKHRVFHKIIDETFQKAIADQNLHTVGNPKIETPDHKTGEGAHDHSIQENQELVFTATVEVMPEIKVKNHLGVKVTRENAEITDEQVSKVVENLQNSQAQLVPVQGGLELADGTKSSRPVQKGDFVDVELTGGVVSEKGLEAHDAVRGNRMIEVGTESYLPGFDEQITGMRQSETKTFRLTLPQDFGYAQLAGKELEINAKVNEVKEKKLPELDEEFAKQMGYTDLADLRSKAHDYLKKERTDEADRKAKSDLLGAIIEKNPFEVPTALIDGQTRALAEDWAQDLKKQGYADKMIQEVILKELPQLKTRAEGQVRASLVLEAIAREEKISISSEELDAEIAQLAKAMEIEEPKLRDFYAKTPGRKDDLEFRLRQERTLKFLLDKAEIKVVPAKVK